MNLCYLKKVCPLTSSCEAFTASRKSSVIASSTIGCLNASAPSIKSVDGCCIDIQIGTAIFEELCDVSTHYPGSTFRDHTLAHVRRK